MLSKQPHRGLFCSSKHHSLNQSPRDLKIGKVSPDSSIQNMKITTTRLSPSPTNLPFHSESTQRTKYKPLTSSERNLPYEFEILKNRIKIILMRMKYKDKLAHLEMLIKQARHLSQRYGYFYVTGAMFVYTPESQTKISLWIHPNLHSQKCIHPINKKTQQLKERQFYSCFKLALKEIFPTISLGDGSTYTSIIDKIYQLKSSLEKRLARSPTSPKFSKIQQKVVKISRLVDFKQQISIIQEGDEEISMISEKQNKQTLKEGKQKFKQLQINLRKLLRNDEENPFQESKIKTNTTRSETPNLIIQFQRILNS